MEEERPLQEAREALSQQKNSEPPIIGDLETKVSPTSAASPSTTPARSGPRMGLVVGGIVAVIVLVIIGLVLFNQGQSGDGDPLAGSALEQRGESTLSIPGEIELTLGNDATVTVGKVSKDDFLSKTDESMSAAADAVPAHLTLASDVYTIAYEENAPAGKADISVPAAAQPYQTLDLYGWYNDNWRFVASSVDSEGGLLTSAEGPLPQALALMQTSVASEPEVGAELLPTQSIPAEMLPHLTEISAGTLTLGQNGTLGGEIVSVPDGGYRTLARVTNTGAIVDTASLSTLLGDAELQEQHNETLLNAVTAGGFAGVNLDYQGVDSDQRAAFTAFVERLAELLHNEGLVLVVSLETPFQDGDSWDTGGQDWAAIGQAADLVRLQMPIEPTVYGDNEKAERLIVWAVRQIERSKLIAMLNIDGVDGVGEVYRTVVNGLALQNFGEIQFVQGAEEVDPGDSVEVALSGSASALEWDSPSLSYKYTYEQGGQTHTVWLGSEASLSHRARFANRYHLAGIAMRGLGTLENAAGYVLALQSYLGAADAPQPASAAIVWAVEDESGGVLTSESGEALAYAWDVGQEPGRYRILARFAQGDHVSTLDSIEISVTDPPEPTPTPEPTETPEPAEEPEEETTAPVAPAQPVAAADPGDSDAAANTTANVRSGPGLGYGVIAGLQTGERVSLLGRNEASTWLQIQMADEETGWVFATLLTVNSSVSVSTLAVVEVDPPAGSGTAGGTSGGGSAPPPVIAPAGGGSFELGGQTHTLANPTLMSMSGMNWVKFQHKWGPGDSPSAVAGRIQQAHANGMKVLLSMPGAAAYPSSIDFNSYVQFLGGVAALGPDAIEVWNEMNIDFEWPAGQIDPASYVNNMLAPAYNAIKGANPNVMVISGAPAPTGFDNGTNAWADSRYMAGVAAAGGGSYMDCIGVHHNAGATSPNASSGHPAGDHYSWYFFPTLNMYYNAFGGSRPVCFTELGYLSGQDFGGVPSRFSWAGNTTVAQHAQWLAEAASLSANSGKVRMMIIFNVDFTHWSDDPQAGYAMLRPDGSCPSCALLGQVMGN
jgi:hypothetical protein